MDNKTMMWLGLGLGAFIILPKILPNNPLTSALTPGTRNPAIDPGQTPVSAAANGYVSPGAPALPLSYSQSYYLAYIYPNMKVANPNILNPNYRLTDAECNVYMSNYANIRTYANDATNKVATTVNDRCRYHWTHWGCVEQRTFLPLPWSDLQAYTPPPPNPNAKSSGGGFFGTLGKIASTFGQVATIFAGADDNQLNDTEAMVLIQAAAIYKDVIPFYKNVAPDKTAMFLKQLDGLVEQYTHNM